MRFINFVYNKFKLLLKKDDLVWDWNNYIYDKFCWFKYL